MKTSSNGLQLVKESEGFVPHVYKDVAGKETIGYGHLLTAEDKRTDKYKDKVLNEKEAEDLLQHDLEAAEKTVFSLIRVALNQNQFDALVDFTFNLGRNALLTSTLRRKLNSGDYASVPEELKKWDKARDLHTNELKAVAGLTTRRNKEAILFSDATTRQT